MVTPIRLPIIFLAATVAKVCAMMPEPLALDADAMRLAPALSIEPSPVAAHESTSTSCTTTTVTAAHVPPTPPTVPVAGGAKNGVAAVQLLAAVMVAVALPLAWM